MASKPEEIDKLDRQIIQMEIEARALANETDEKFIERLKILEEELSELKAKSNDLTEKWHKEKRAT